MRHLKGFSLLGIVITIAIILILVYGVKYFTGEQQKNQIQEGQRAIDQAKKSSEQQNQSDLYLQNEIQDSPPVNYHGIQNQLKDIKQ